MFAAWTMLKQEPEAIRAAVSEDSPCCCMDYVKTRTRGDQCRRVRGQSMSAAWTTSPLTMPSPGGRFLTAEHARPLLPACFCGRARQRGLLQTAETLTARRETARIGAPSTRVPRGRGSHWVHVHTEARVLLRCPIRMPHPQERAARRSERGGQGSIRAGGGRADTEKRSENRNARRLAEGATWGAPGAPRTAGARISRRTAGTPGTGRSGCLIPRPPPTKRWACRWVRQGWIISLVGSSLWLDHLFGWIVSLGP